MSDQERIEAEVSATQAGQEGAVGVGQVADADVAPIIVGLPSPGRQTLSWFRRVGWVSLPITNLGDAEVVVDLVASVDGRPFRFTWQAPGAEIVSTNGIRFPLGPGETVSVMMTITPVQDFPLKSQRKTYPCRLIVRRHDELEPFRLVTAQIRTEPLLGPGWPTLLLALLLGLLGLALVPLLTRPFDPAEPGQTRRFVPIPNEAPTQADSTVSEALPLQPVPDPLSYEAIFKEAAGQYDLDWRILVEQAYWESRMDPLAIGAHQEAGLMQIYPTTWQEWSEKLGVTDPFDPYSNVLVSAAYMAFLRDHFKSIGYPEAWWMLAAYNWGPVNLHQLLETGGSWQEVPEETRQYSLTILEAAQAGQIRPEIREVLQQPVSATFD